MNYDVDAPNLAIILPARDNSNIKTKELFIISLDELLPVSRSYGNEHLSIIGIMLGMLVMGLSLALL